MKTIAIVLAAGSGKRMQSATKKQYLLVDEKPVLYYSLKTFEESFIDQVVIVASKEDEAFIRDDIIARYHLKKVASIVEGGAERYHSVLAGLREADRILEENRKQAALQAERDSQWTFISAHSDDEYNMVINGFRVREHEVFFDDEDANPDNDIDESVYEDTLMELKNDTNSEEELIGQPMKNNAGKEDLTLKKSSKNNTEKTYVFIHDGARPMIDQNMLKRALEAVKEYDACVVGVPSKDTVKISDEAGMVADTPKRDLVWSVQTPQVFELNLIKAAYEDIISREKQLKEDGISITDDAMVLEISSHHPVKLVEGSYKNIKVTTPEDLLILKQFLQQ